MKFINYTRVLLSFFVVAVLYQRPTQAISITLTGPTSSASNVGDYATITGNDAASSPGQILDILLHEDQNGTFDDSTTDNGGTPFTMGQLYDTLISDKDNIDTNNDGTADVAITSLVFGLGINESGSVGSNNIVVNDLVLTFNLPDTTTSEFRLDNGTDNTVTVVNYTQGQNTAEARFRVDLGFDFMTTYNSSSTETFLMESTIDNQSDGFEIYFLSSGFSAEASVPFEFSPTLGIILSSIIFGGAKLSTYAKSFNKFVKRFLKMTTQE